MNKIFPPDIVPNKQLAKAINRCERTVVRWQDAVDGLPFIKIGKERYVHVPTWQEWIMLRMRQRNPSRRGRRRRTT